MLSSPGGKLGALDGMGELLLYCFTIFFGFNDLICMFEKIGEWPTRVEDKNETDSFMQE